MLGALQIGMSAAIIVVLVPMAMAGWHLSRNKMLFFSGALFISLAVAVHLTPFFPSFFLISSSNSAIKPSSSSSSPIIFDPRRHRCLSLLHRLNFSSNSSWSWYDSPEVSSCGFRRLSSGESGELLNGSWIVVAGDSQARLIALSLLSLLLPPDSVENVKSDLFKRHSDYRASDPSLSARIEFVWAPYASNLTGFVKSLSGSSTSSSSSPPDVIVLGAGLWHMLRVNNESDYGDSLRELREAVVGDRRRISSSRMFWIGMPTLINALLNTPEKRERMRDEVRGYYDRQLWRSKLLRQSGGPLLLLDVESLSWNCGVRCTVDGMHYDDSVYDAAVQVMLNALLIDSHQNL